MTHALGDPICLYDKSSGWVTVCLHFLCDERDAEVRLFWTDCEDCSPEGVFNWDENRASRNVTIPADHHISPEVQIPVHLFLPPPSRIRLVLAQRDPHRVVWAQDAWPRTLEDDPATSHLRLRNAKPMHRGFSLSELRPYERLPMW